MKKTYRSLFVILPAVAILFMFSVFSVAAENGKLNVADFIAPDCGEDVSVELQKLIDENPNRTLYFPDGEYIVSAPVLTPADPSKAVSLCLSDFTVIRASEDFEGGAVIQLGGKNPCNDTHTPGSVYGLYGGVIDCSGTANGISINSGRETRVQNVSVKNSVIGLHIMDGANNGSSDADISDVNIIGTNTKQSVGVLIEGHDNTLTNMRIGAVYTGVILNSSGNMLRNIHPLYYGDYTDYENSCGFLINNSNNWLDYCYSDEFGTGFRTTGSGKIVMNDCFCFWYSDRGTSRTAFRADERFNSVITNFTVNMFGTKNDKAFVISKPGGQGVITNAVISGSDGSHFYYAYSGDADIISKLLKIVFKLLGIFYFTFR